MTKADFIVYCLLFAAALPFFTCFVLVFSGNKRVSGATAGQTACGAMFLSFLACAVALVAWFYTDQSTIVRQINWIPLQTEQIEVVTPKTNQGFVPVEPIADAKPVEGGVAPVRWMTLGVLIDSLTLAMMAMVSLIAFLVHLYSIGYMKGDKRYGRFFAYLSLFTFSMMGIVLSHSLLQLFIFWELVGLTSYLLIGFWFEKRGPQLACKKAFVMNRIGDMGFLIGFGILFYKLGGEFLLLPAAEGATGEDGKVFSMFSQLQAVLNKESAYHLLEGDFVYSITNPPLWLTVAGIGLFFGAIGKSAQFPLHTWLPDAMEGPTPVSSIVHSATMVAAGVYLTGRIYPILTPDAHVFVSTIGLITLVMAALMALVMTDIKRVLAYSTLSQLGYMILGLGTGSYVFAIYHLITHAFFKCCLFQCSGSVINAAHHEQDMTQYGGLKDKMPITCLCYAICTIAIAGGSIPLLNLGLTGGYYSKDGIIAGTFNYGHAWGGFGTLFYWGPTVIAYVTAFYMARSFALTFLGKPRNQHIYDHAHEAPRSMTIPQLVLAGMAVISWPIFLWFPMINDTHAFMVNDLMGGTDSAWVQGSDMHSDENHHAMHFVHLALLYGFGWILAIGAGILIYKDGFAISDRIAKLPVIKLFYAWAYNKFYFDALYDILAVWCCKLLAVLAAAFDKYIIDGIVNLSAYITRFTAWISGLFDNRIVDGSVNGAAAFAHSTGNIMRATQAGRVRGYVLLLFVSAALVTLVVVTVAVTIL